MLQIDDLLRHTYSIPFRVQIDDPAGAFAVHGLSGIWGVMFVGLLAKEQYVIDVSHGWVDVYQSVKWSISQSNCLPFI